MNHIEDLSQLESNLNYTFGDRSFLVTALMHSSYVNEQSDAILEDNERLEFLGDAVLNLVIGDALMHNFPELNEGNLSRMRSNLVNETQLAEIARQLDLGLFICLGKGESQTNGRDKNSILSDVLEAVIAAVYLDGGFDSAYKLISRHFKPLLSGVRPTRLNSDSKSLLQEYSQVHLKEIPRYRVVSEMGPDHDKTFQVCLKTSDIETMGYGKSKKAAEQDAARLALELLKERGL
ncbi:ribonuclease 3 [Desulfoluna limicola]|uniref:Ribonuclease 3 n=1 Tax=Desulfoluna limicola TaxID=2810562 RepID=A0ABN6F842_9BACT|nr:ribonuclease III [Desulfoluna limicola]BCS98276.1 ribonuclease 3 [Desulfoluna limicola]